MSGQHANVKGAALTVARLTELLAAEIRWPTVDQDPKPTCCLESGMSEPDAKLTSNRAKSVRLEDHEARCPVDLASLWREEEKAREITVFAPGTLPELVQTQDFSYDVLERSGAPVPRGIDRLLEAQAQHQQVVLDGDAMVRLFVSLSALSSGANDGGKVLVGQRERLLRLSLRLRNSVIIRVVPDGFGFASGFTLLRSPSGESVICPVSDHSGLLLSAPGHVVAYRAILDQLDAVSWPVGKSKKMLAELAVPNPHDVESDAQSNALCARLGIDVNEH